MPSSMYYTDGIEVIANSYVEWMDECEKDPDNTGKQRAYLMAILSLEDVLAAVTHTNLLTVQRDVLSAVLERTQEVI